MILVIFLVVVPRAWQWPERLEQPGFPRLPVLTGATTVRKCLQKFAGSSKVLEPLRLPLYLCPPASCTGQVVWVMNSQAERQMHS